MCIHLNLSAFFFYEMVCVCVCGCCSGGVLWVQPSESAVMSKIKDSLGLMYIPGALWMWPEISCGMSFRWEQWMFWGGLWNRYWTECQYVLQNKESLDLRVCTKQQVCYGNIVVITFYFYWKMYWGLQEVQSVFFRVKWCLYQTHMHKLFTLPNLMSYITHKKFKLRSVYVQYLNK